MKALILKGFSCLFLGIIKKTDAVVKGQTAASSYKPATLDNGLNILVPPFIEAGEKILLDTRSLEYIKKSN